MGKKNNITFNIDFVGHAEKLNSAIKEVQSKINNMKINPKMKESFDKDFEAIGKTLEDIGKKASKGITTSKQSADLQNLYGIFESQWGNISKRIGNMEVKPEKFFPVEVKNSIEAANTALKRYNDQLKEVEKYDKGKNKKYNVSDKDEEIKAAKAKLKELEKLSASDTGKRKSVEEIKKDSSIKDKEKELQATEELRKAGVLTQKQVDEKIRKQENHIESLEKERQTIENSRKTAEELLKVRKQEYDLAAKNSADAISKFNEQVTDTTSTTAETQSEITSGKKAIDEGTTALKNQEDQAQATAAAMDRLKRAFSFGSVVTMITRSLREAVQVIKDLDAAMTETAVVTSYTVSDMWDQLDTYTKNANALGATTQGAYETMTLFYQQGLNSTQAWDLGIETMKMAR